MKLYDLKCTTYTQQRHQSVMVEGDTSSETSNYLAVSIAESVAVKTVGFFTLSLSPFASFVSHLAYSNCFNPLKTKRRLLYLKVQSVPRSKRFACRLEKLISLWYKWHKSLFVLR